MCIFQLKSFCECEPKEVSFSPGSIIITVNLEYGPEYTSQTVIAIMTEGNQVLLPGHNTSSVALILPNGGKHKSILFNIIIFVYISIQIILVSSKGYITFMIIS